MVAEKEIKEAVEAFRLVFNCTGVSDIKNTDDLLVYNQKISDIIVGMAVDFIAEATINRIRVEMPYLIYTQQERL